jgi:hypothetical protein
MSFALPSAGHQLTMFAGATVQSPCALGQTTLAPVNVSAMITDLIIVFMCLFPFHF